MESEKWKARNGKWEMENEKWKMENEKRPRGLPKASFAWFKKVNLASVAGSQRPIRH